MAKKPVCLVCQKEMVRGFLIDQGDYGTLHTARWCQGVPQHSFLTGEVKQEQFKHGFKVAAYRCPECEALRLYAPSGGE